jgi:NADPH-dependent 2,4-dienoyl-CoA reductase/sulfur reductase-like enzyme
MASRQAGFVGEIMVVGAEPHPPYERPPLPKRLVDVDDVESALRPIVPADQLRSNDIVLRLGLRVRAIDSSAGTVLLDDGETLAADSVLLATARARADSTFRAVTWRASAISATPTTPANSGVVCAGRLLWWSSVPASSGWRWPRSLATLGAR